jgi:site-specific DNA-methyltransferase (adenine-specific)
VTSPIDLRLGRWQDALADVTTCDAVITDVPYSARTVKGHRSGSLKRGTDGAVIGKGTLRDDAIAYAGLTEEETRAVVRWSMARASRWVVVFCDHIQWMWMADEVQKAKWMGFQPIPWVKSDGGTPRFTADGPSSSSEWILIARPRRRCITRYRPGHYDTLPNYERSIVGAKPVNLMAAIVRDYSEPGDLIVDPFCGSGTTALAAAMEGRRCITSEEKPEHYAIARKRLDKGYQPCLLP